jgi:hypothetical protein
MFDLDKTPSNDTESTIGSDEDDITKKKSRSSIDDDLDFDNDDLNGSDPRNIWRKRRKFIDPYQLLLQTESNESTNSNNNNNQMKTTNEYKNVDTYPKTNSLHMRPHDHQVPIVLPVQNDDLMTMSARLVRQKKKRNFYIKFFFSSSVRSGYSIPDQFGQLPIKRQSFITSPQSIEQLQELYRAHSSTTSDLSTYDYPSRRKFS